MISPNPTAASAVLVPEAKPTTPAPAPLAPAPPSDFPYAPGDPLPPELSPEAAKLMGKANGPALIAELIPVVQFFDKLTRYRWEAIRAGERPSLHSGELNSALQRRRIYAARAASLAAVAKLKLELEPATEIPDIRLLMQAEGARDVTGHLASQAAKTRQELEQAKAALRADTDTLTSAALYREAGYLETAHWREERALLARAQEHRRLLAKFLGGTWADLQRRTPSMIEAEIEFKILLTEVSRLDRVHRPRRWSQDAMVDRINAHVLKVRELSDRLVIEEGSHKQVRELVGRKVREAIEQAGGRQAVLDAIRQASIASETWLEVHPDWPLVITAEKRLDALSEQIGKLDPGSPLHTSFVQEGDELRARCDAMRAAIAAKRLEDIGVLLDSAAEGVEMARAGIEAIATQTPQAFNSEFVTSIATAKDHRILLAEFSRMVDTN
jgi:hypothetical protein